MVPTEIRRRGAAAVLVIVCLTLLGVLLASMARLQIMHHRRIRAAEYQAQAGWLVDAGIERAVARFTQDPTYLGETWEIGPDQLGGRAGRVLIEVPPSEDGASAAISIRVTADYPSDGTRAETIQELREIKIKAPTQINGETS